MTREEKIRLGKELGEKFQRAQGVVFTDYRGLDVEQISTLRNELRRAGAEYKVVKNRIMWRAVSGMELDEQGKRMLFIGPVAVAFSYQEPTGAAKVIKEFAAENKALGIKGALLEGRLLDKAAVMELAALPGRQELLSLVLAGMQAPVSGFVRTLAGVLSQFVRVLDAVREQKQSQGGA